jgi:hypothetical protein
MEGLDSPSYLFLNKKGNLATPISSGFMTPKLVFNGKKKLLMAVPAVRRRHPPQHRLQRGPPGLVHLRLRQHRGEHVGVRQRVRRRGRTRASVILAYQNIFNSYLRDSKYSMLQR